MCLYWWLFKWESQLHPEALFSEAPAGREVLCSSRAEVLLPARSSCPASNSLSCASSRYLLLKTHQLSLDAFLVALKFMQVEGVDIAEVQCILANLIYMGHIKGYISHQHQKLVVSKQNPFPPLSTVC